MARTCGIECPMQVAMHSPGVHGNPSSVEIVDRTRFASGSLSTSTPSLSKMIRSKRVMRRSHDRPWPARFGHAHWTGPSGSRRLDGSSLEEELLAVPQHPLGPERHEEHEEE